MKVGEQGIRWRLALLIFGIGLIGRLFGIFHSTLFEPVTSDSRVFDEIAQNLLAGRGFYSEYEPARSYRPPLYPFFLAGLYALAGHNYTVVRIVQSFLGAGAAVLVFAIGVRQFNARVGLLAGVGTAVYPLLLVLPNGLLTENVYNGLLLLILWLATTGGQHPKAHFVLLMGFVVGLTALTRPNALPFPAFFLIGLVFGNRVPWPVALRTTALLTATLLLTILPWTIRNYTVHSRWILISTNGAVTFWAANNSFLKPHQDQAPEIVRFTDRFEPYNEIELAELAWRQSLQFIRNNPSLYLTFCARRFFFFWSSDLLFLKYRIPWVGLLVTAGLGGLVALWIWRKAVWLYLVIVWHLAVYIPLHAEPRYHVPLIPVLLIFTAIGLDLVYRKVRNIPIPAP